MNDRFLNTKSRRKLSLFLSTLTVFTAVFILAQLMFSASMVQPVFAGSTLTPTVVVEPPDPLPTNTPIPPPTDVPPTSTPIPTNTPEPAPTNPPSTGGSNTQPTSTPTPEPVIPQEIPELGVGDTWGPLMMTFTILLIALGIAAFQVRALLRMSSD
ncbi:MAG: hypothetical protein AB8G95_00580 [Anaerolineae bacterium]